MVWGETWHEGRIVERWWNGSWGRLTRRDIWLRTDDHRWRVEVRQGDADARLWYRWYTDEADARRFVTELKDRGALEWTDLTDLVA